MSTFSFQTEKQAIEAEIVDSYSAGLKLAITEIGVGLDMPVRDYKIASNIVGEEYDDVVNYYDLYECYRDSGSNDYFYFAVLSRSEGK